MEKANKTTLSRETYRRIKGMNREELSHYVSQLYIKGYEAALKHIAGQDNAKPEAAKPETKPEKEQKPVDGTEHVWGRVSGTDTPLDGLTLILSRWEWDNGECWHLTSWKPEDDEAVMKAMHAADDVYCDMPIDEFRKIWKEGGWEPEGAYCIDLEKVEIVEKIEEGGDRKQ